MTPNQQRARVPMQRSIIFFSFLVVIVLGAYALTNREVDASAHCDGGRLLLNPRFRCGRNAVVSKQGYAQLRADITSYIEAQERDGKASVVGIWFRDLDDGPTFGINDRIDFIPASLLKLPLALTYLQIAEDHPEILQQTIQFNDLSVEVPSQTFFDHEDMEKGKEYSIEQLLIRAIEYSDNVASQLLFNYLRASYGSEILSQTYRDLGIVEMGSDITREVVNTKGYGSIFRMLYNGSFLGPEMSEKLLSWLVHSDFRNGIRQGIPDSVLVAEKFGERFLSDGTKQLHSCGIIYYPGNPYQLCVMTKGNSFDELKNTIARVSEMVYEEFDSRKLR